jgi:ceramide glucosyltransferase
MIPAILGWLLLALAVIGSGFTIAAANVLVQFLGARQLCSPRDQPVTVLKPLHGAEPHLVDNLATFLCQDHAGPIQLLCGVQRRDDPAIEAVETLRRRFPDARIDLIIDPTPHGSNGKIANLINMESAIAHDVVVLSDSDMVVPPSYLTAVLAALDQPKVGLITCLYRGRGDGGFWSRLGAAGISYRFLPLAAFMTAKGKTGLTCMGSTIALRRRTLNDIGGFKPFADILADDHAIGQAVGALGLVSAIPPLLLTHAAYETSLGALWRHELRWAATVRGLTPPVVYVASVITLPLPLALAGLIFHPLAGIGIVIAALAAKLFAATAVNRVAGEATLARGLLPIRDALSLIVFIASFGVRSVDWRGRRLRITTGGRAAIRTDRQAEALRV